MLLLESKYANERSSWNETDQSRMRDLVRLADSVCMQIYFASGAFRDNPEEKVPRGEQERRRFWDESRPVLELLAQFPHPSLTHHLLQTIEYFVPLDPDETFLLIGRVVLKGREGGYQYESLAIDLIVRLIERFIAEFPDRLQENVACRKALIDILDIFIEAGWPAARRLTYRMEDVFR